MQNLSSGGQNTFPPSTRDPAKKILSREFRFLEEKQIKVWKAKRKYETLK